MDIKKDYQIFLKGEDKTNSISHFEKVGGKYKIVFKSGKVFKYNAENVQIIESVLKEQKPRAVFQYLNRLAESVGIKADLGDGKDLNILAHNFSQLGFVDPNSLFGHFLSGKRLNTNLKIKSKKAIYPFGFNGSQKVAVEQALKNRMSIIQGPPGTGKTQTILNLIANIVSNGESIAVVSSNNSAIQNVYEKLEKNEVGFIAAFLGNSSNKKQFVESQPVLPDLTSWMTTETDIEKLDKETSRLHAELEEKLKNKIKLSKKKKEYSEINLERNHFLLSVEDDIAKTSPVYLNKVTSPDQALELWLSCENFKKLSWFWASFYLIVSLVSRRASQIRFIDQLVQEFSIDSLIIQFQKRFYELKESKLKKEITAIEKDLEDYDFSQKMKMYSNLSLKVFKGKLSQKYKDGRTNVYEIGDLRKHSQEFLKDYPVVLSTTYSLLSSLSRDVSYDYVIVDESSQVDLCTGALALSCANKIVVVGDLKQLPHVVDSKMASMTDSLFEEYDLPEAYRYKRQSLLSSLIEVFPDIPQTLLKEHYRCHPRIIEFCNKKFYNGDLVVLTECEDVKDPLIVYKTVEGNHARNKVNIRQIDVIKNEIIPQQKLSLTNGSLGIISPYRNQTNVLQEAFKEYNVKADTVDKFQGQEKDIIILSTVDNEISRFTDNENRLNVAVSRAAKQLILIVNEGDSLKDRNIGDLVKYIEYNNYLIVQSKVKSVFDYLFKSYAEKRKDFFKDKRRVSKFDSENLMHHTLREIFKERDVNGLDIALHVPLNMIIFDTSLLDSSEKNFVINTQSHVDFLIFEKMGKKPLFAVEVDGAFFHKDSSRQAQRDKMKDTIFTKYDLPLYRFRTDESGEKQRVVDILTSLGL